MTSDLSLTTLVRERSDRGLMTPLTKTVQLFLEQLLYYYYYVFREVEVEFVMLRYVGHTKVTHIGIFV